MRQNLGDFDRHLSGMRALTGLAVNAQLHRQVMRVRNLVGCYDPRAQGTKRIDALAEAENAGLHLPPLNVTRGDIVENDVPAYVATGFFWTEVLASLLQ